MLHFKNKVDSIPCLPLEKNMRKLNLAGVSGVCAVFEGRKEKESDWSVGVSNGQSQAKLVNRL